MRPQLSLAVCGVAAWLLIGWHELGTGQTPSAGGERNASAVAGIGVGGLVPQRSGGAAAGHMIGFSAPSSRDGQLVSLVDTSRQWMAVYHIDGSGQIHLVSSRPISQDFAVQYNATVPLPKEMREVAGR